MATHFQNNNVSLPFCEDMFDDFGRFSTPREPTAFKSVQDDGQSLSAGTILVIGSRVECRLWIVDNPPPGNTGAPFEHTKAQHNVSRHIKGRVLRNSVGSRRNPWCAKRMHILELDAFFDLRAEGFYPEGSCQIINSC